MPAGEASPAPALSAWRIKTWFWGDCQPVGYCQLISVGVKVHLEPPGGKRSCASTRMQLRESRETRHEASLISDCNSRRNTLPATMLELPPAASVLNHCNHRCRIQPCRPQPLVPRRCSLLGPQEL